MSEERQSEEISDELTVKLIHFQEVTQIEDLDRCRTILEQHDWDVGRAVRTTLTDPNDPGVTPNLPSTPQVNHSNHTLPRTPPPRPIIQNHRMGFGPQRMFHYQTPSNPPQGILGWGYFFLVSPFRFTFNRVFDILRFVWQLFYPDPRLRITDPRGDVVSFINDFKSKYSQTPNFFQGSYKDAQEEAKKQIRFLLLYIHNKDCADTAPFCEATLCHPESIEYINRNMIFWACSIHKPEGYRVSRVLRGPTYPTLAVICSVHNRMTVVGKLEGKSTSEELIARLSEIVEAYEPTLVAIRAEKNALNMNQKIRQEQDEAYQRCLRLDQEKMDKKKKEEEEVLKIKEIKEKKKNDKVLAKQRWLQRKETCRLELRDEPSPDTNDIVLLKIKLPNGMRLTRRFLSTDSVKVLHDYVYSQEDSPPRFQVFSNFPRRCIPGCSTDEVDAGIGGDLPTLKDAGLLRSETLNIQEVLNDESSASESDGSCEEEKEEER